MGTVKKVIRISIWTLKIGNCSSHVVFAAHIAAQLVSRLNKGKILLCSDCLKWSFKDLSVIKVLLSL